jgi:apolipoprotein D and lipocalin family protein
MMIHPAIALVVALAAVSVAGDTAERPAGPSVDLARYMGAWHEIAHLPNSPQRGCADTIVYYRLAKNGGFELMNTCWKGGKYKPYHGWAKPAGGGDGSKFRVKFFGLFGADYWIEDLAPDYAWAAVGSAKRDQFWVIARERTLDDETYQGILARARARGYELSRLERAVVTGKNAARPPW